MELILKIENKNLKYSSGKIEAEGLENLIKSLGELEFSEIVLSGESKSYTFLRQVALLVNILIKTKKCSLKLKSDSFSMAGDLVFPIYK
jgi:hypothetical protein